MKSRPKRELLWRRKIETVRSQEFSFPPGVGAVCGHGEIVFPEDGNFRSLISYSSSSLSLPESIFDFLFVVVWPLCGTAGPASRRHLPELCCRSVSRRVEMVSPGKL